MVYAVSIAALGSGMAVEEEPFAGLGFNYFVLDTGEGLFHHHIRHESVMACDIAANASFIRMSNFRTRDANMGGAWTGRAISTVYDVEHIKGHMKVLFNISEVGSCTPARRCAPATCNTRRGA